MPLSLDDSLELFWLFGDLFPDCVPDADGSEVNLGFCRMELCNSLFDNSSTFQVLQAFSPFYPDSPHRRS